ncbi:hypothetical protein CANARDRAFT_160149 [[Candida] arabinofermentans NRRL YB-2248]|uniref:Uncharacterized protein n=1 Tax=[Candida] arabinofermentans NRRL YB-2248 TaxID=983967 RepID=A0A1E4T0E9_9ASCO|nr:hypothetical protein CANARDRAFT_160149 [[Candida] arabinofermentans NRRL YB-2248]
MLDLFQSVILLYRNKVSLYINMSAIASNETAVSSASLSKLKKKQSLSILSGSSMNKLNNHQPSTLEKPIRERIISESTGLIKFALRKTSFKLPDQPLTTDQNDTKEKHAEEESDQKQGLPIYIPINFSEETMSSDTTAVDLDIQNLAAQRSVDDETAELLFLLASKQRKAMELKTELATVADELKILENRYKSLMGQRGNTTTTSAMDKGSNEGTTGFSVKSTLTSKSSIMNFGIGGNSNSTTRPVSESSATDTNNFAKAFNNFTNNISSNINNNELLNKGKEMMENLNKENEKWFSDLNSKTLKLRIDNNSNPVIKKLLPSRLAQNDKISQPFSQVKFDTDTFKASINNIFNLSNPQKNKQLASDESYINMAESSMINSTEASFEYSDCHYYDDSRNQKSPVGKLTRSPVKLESVLEADQSILNSFSEQDILTDTDDEDYGGHAVPYKA